MLVVALNTVHCDHLIPVFPLIPPYSVSESPKSLFFLDLASGFEPEGESPKATSATDGSYGGSNPSRRTIDSGCLGRFALGPSPRKPDARADPGRATNRIPQQFDALASPPSSLSLSHSGHNRSRFRRNGP